MGDYDLAKFGPWYGDLNSWDDYLKVILDRQNRLLEFLNEPRALEEVVEA